MPHSDTEPSGTTGPKRLATSAPSAVEMVDWFSTAATYNEGSDFSPRSLLVKLGSSSTQDGRPMPLLKPRTSLVHPARERSSICRESWNRYGGLRANPTLLTVHCSF